MRILFALVSVGAATFALAQVRAEITPDNVRVQLLSDSLVRIELRGPKGFEDRKTFMVQNRDLPGPKQWATWKSEGGAMGLEFGRFRVSVHLPAKSLTDVTVTDMKGAVLYHGSDTPPPPAYFPDPSADWKVFVVADSPRIVPPAWGATPAPPGAPFAETSGWDVSNPSTDLYVFLNTGAGYRQFVADYLKLTGKIELPPLYAFGLMDSRYYPYTQQAALDVIDRYRQRGFPLDVFVLDTDWRVGASKGYAVNTKLWPDLAGFIRDVHGRGVKTMFNDHPEPQAPTALDPRETQFRWDGLTSVLKLGADVWWYDRNWITHLREPVPGLKAEIWGQRVFHDVTERFRPGVRPLVMSNVQGIDNGLKKYPPQPGFHRYPIYWSGDTKAEWAYLKFGVANAVNSGVDSLLPFVSEDLTGHTGHPTPELYVRFMEFGCLSPVTRIHCAAGETRFPWDYGSEAEAVVREYVKMRYRLLPTIYSVARRSHDDGTPLLRRCDLVWPGFKEAASGFQYMLGDDILVAPVVESKDGQAEDVPPAYLHTKGGEPGLSAEYFSNAKLEGQPTVVRTDAKVGFDWGQGSPDPKVPADSFSVRWKGVLGPVPESGEYVVGTRSDDGVKLLVDGNFVVSKWSSQDGATNFKTLKLERGKSYDVELDYYEATGDALCHLVWTPPSARKRLTRRVLWLPPGDWTELWTGRRLKGPSRLTLDVPLSQTPMFVRGGAVVFLGDQVATTGKGVWASPMADIYPFGGNGTVSREMYEDDGRSTQYLTGQSASTRVSVARSGHKLAIDIGPTRGDYDGMARVRPWRVRVNLPPGTGARAFKLDGRSVAPVPTQSPKKGSAPFQREGGLMFDVPPGPVTKPHRIEITLSGPDRG